MIWVSLIRHKARWRRQWPTFDRRRSCLQEGVVVEPKRGGDYAGELPYCSERGVIHGDDAVDPIGALFRREECINTSNLGQTHLRGIVVGHRIGESRERDRVGVDCNGAVSRRMCVTGSTSEESVATVIHGNRVSGNIGLRSDVMVSS